MRLPVSSNLKQNLFNLNKNSRKRLVKVAKLAFVPEQAKIGPALAQLGINSMEFCERFNLQTRSFDKELTVFVKLNVFSDKSFNYVLKSFQLKDLVSSFFFETQLVSIFSNKELPDNISFLNNILVSFYKAFLVFNSEKLKLKKEGLEGEQFIKLFCAYLKSYNY